MTAVSCLVLTMVCSTGEAQSKGKLSPNPKVEVEIDDNGYSVAGDGQPYRDGVGGVEAQIWKGGSEDMTLRLYNSTRRFTVSYHPVGCDPKTSPDCPLESYSSGWFINIQKIGDMQDGETRWTRAHLLVLPSKNSTTSFDWSGLWDFQPPLQPEPGVTLANIPTEPLGSNFLVSVYKDVTGWVVSTSDDIYDPNGEHVSPRAELIYSTSRNSGSLGEFELSFRLVIRPLTPFPPVQ